MAGILSTILAYGVAAPICLFGGVKSLVNLPKDFEGIKSSQGAWKTSCSVVDLVGDVGKSIGGISAPVALWISGACDVSILDDFSLAFEGKPDKIKLDDNKGKKQKMNKRYIGLTRNEIIELKKLLENMKSASATVNSIHQVTKDINIQDNDDNSSFDDE